MEKRNKRKVTKSLKVSSIHTYTLEFCFYRRSLQLLAAHHDFLKEALTILTIMLVINSKMREEKGRKIKLQIASTYLHMSIILYNQGSFMYAQYNTG